MGVFVTMLLQSAASLAPPPSPDRFNLHLTDPNRLCAADVGEDILVCGQRDEGRRYRLPTIDASRYGGELRAETTLRPGLKGAIEVENTPLAPGMISNRIMVRLKIAF